jgi:hypothetical protein
MGRRIWWTALVLIAALIFLTAANVAFTITGDLDGDGDVDRNDLDIILAARNTPASGPDDPRDLDGDGMITALDARKLVILCTRPRCEGVRRVVEFPAANPDAILVNEPTKVTVTVQIGADPELLISEIYLLRLDEQDNIINLGRLYDDGTHGDALVGDGTFTTQYIFDEVSPGEIRLKISVSYSTPPTLAYSDVITIDVLSLPSSEVVDEVLNTNKEASNNFDNWAQQFGLDQARQIVIESLKAKPNVTEVVLSPDGTTISIRYDSGLETALFTGLEGTDGVPSSNIGIVASPLYSDPRLPTDAECKYLNNKLESETCIKSTVLADANVTLESIKNLDNKGVIFIHSHGGILGILRRVVGIMTGEEASTILGIPTSHLRDWILGRIEPVTVHGRSYWAFKPSYITHYATSFPNSLVVISACHSLGNETMANAFLSKGAAAYVGWSGTVRRSFAIAINQTLFDRLVAGKTLQQAFNEWTLAQRTDPFRNAVYQFRGDGDIKLPKELVTNGGFETGDLSGWTTGFTLGGDFPEYGAPGGYWTVTSERKIEGNYAARLGRFDQAYTQGVYGPPQPGDEPSGIDWMYQDVKIPAGTNKTLKFSYKIRTYDTAVWDWFDMYVKDPYTGTILATVVQKAGKPGTRYGEYWENEWTSVSYDLTPFAGREIRLWFGNRQDGWGDQNATYIDKVSIECMP